MLRYPCLQRDGWRALVEEWLRKNSELQVRIELTTL